MQRPRAANALDSLALALVLVAAVIVLTGGFSLRVGGGRVTARSPDRAVLAALAVVALRLAIDRRTRPLASAPQLIRSIRDRVYVPLQDSVVEPVEPRGLWRSRAMAAVGFCVFAAVLLFPQLRHMDSVPDLGDPLFSIWRFGWVYHKLGGGDPRPLFSPNVFHPHQLTLTYSDSMLLPALTTAPFLAMGIHPVVVYNLVTVLSFIASAFAMYLLVERLTGSRAGAFVAGLLFGFYPYRFEHYSHFELQMTYCMPLALLALHRFVTTARTRDAVAFALLAAAQLYCSMYYAVFFTVYVTALLAALCWLTRPALGRMLGPAAIAGALALVLAVPLARTYSSAQLGDREVPTVTYYSATAADYLRAHPRSATWGNRTLPGRMHTRVKAIKNAETPSRKRWFFSSGKKRGMASFSVNRRSSVTARVPCTVVSAESGSQWRVIRSVITATITAKAMVNDQPATLWIMESVVFVDCLPNFISIDKTAVVPSTTNKILTIVLISGDIRSLLFRRFSRLLRTRFQNCSSC